MGILDEYKAAQHKRADSLNEFTQKNLGYNPNLRVSEDADELAAQRQSVIDEINRQAQGGVYSSGLYDNSANWINENLAGVPQHVGFTDDPDNITETAATNPDDPYGGKYLNPDRKAPLGKYTDLGTYYTDDGRALGRGEAEIARMAKRNAELAQKAKAAGFTLNTQEDVDQFILDQNARLQAIEAERNKGLLDGLGEWAEGLNPFGGGDPTPPPPVEGPVEVRGNSLLDSVSGALGSLNPISDANASSRNAALGAAAASIPNPHLARAGGLNPALAGAEGLIGTGGSGAVAPTQDEQLQFQYGRATDTAPRQVYNKGWFGNSWDQETPQQIAQRQQEGQQAFTQRTGWEIPQQQDSFLGQQFQHQVDTGGSEGFQSQDRDYWGGGSGSTDVDRTVTTSSGHLANAPTAQGDASIQALLDDPSAGWGGTYDDGGDDDHGWDSNPAASSPGSELDFDDSGVDWDSIYDTGPEPVQDSGGGDDSGGGGK